MITEKNHKATPAGRLVLAVFLLAVSAGLIACGGGKKDTAVATDDSAGMDIDQLLGIDQQQEETPAADKKADDEAEVLRLLGISPEESRDEPADQQNTEAEAGSVRELQEKIRRLERELAEKEVVIADLRNDLEEKDRRLTMLQTQALAGKSSAPQPTASAGGADVSAASGGSFKARYDRALSLYKARRYKDAIAAFSELLAENPNHSLSDNCQYWIGEAYYGLGNYEQAIAEFEKVYSYPNSNKLDDAIIKLGVTYLKLGNREAARSQFEQLIANYPKSEFVELARSYLAKL